MDGRVFHGRATVLCDYHINVLSLVVCQVINSTDGVSYRNIESLTLVYYVFIVAHHQNWLHNTVTRFQF